MQKFDVLRLLCFASQTDILEWEESSEIWRIHELKMENGQYIIEKTCSAILDRCSVIHKVVSY